MIALTSRLIRCLVTAVLLLAASASIGSASTSRQKASGGHAAGSSSSHPRATRSPSPRATSSKPVHVRSYTKKDGTRVAAHDRALPRTRSATTARSTRTVTPRASRSTTTRAASPRTTSTGVASWTTNGRIVRSEAAKHTFESQTGFPHGRPGYVVDHVKPLACGGADVPANMQWQTTAEAKAKDKWERAGCR
jgi:5-methylcytosine-specific restriction endonuclease McrA